MHNNNETTAERMQRAPAFFRPRVDADPPAIKGRCMQIKGIPSRMRNFRWRHRNLLPTCRALTVATVGRNSGGQRALFKKGKERKRKSGGRRVGEDGSAVR